LLDSTGHLGTAREP